MKDRLVGLKINKLVRSFLVQLPQIVHSFFDFQSHRMILRYIKDHLVHFRINILEKIIGNDQGDRFQVFQRHRPDGMDIAAVCHKQITIAHLLGGTIEINLCFSMDHQIQLQTPVPVSGHLIIAFRTVDDHLGRKLFLHFDMFVKIIHMYPPIHSPEPAHLSDTAPASNLLRFYDRPSPRPSVK